MRHIRFLLLLGLVTAVMPAHAAQPYVLDTVAAGLEHPWGIAFLPDGSYLVTERTGALRRVSADGLVGPALAGVPPVFFRGQGGLLDVVLDPDFSAGPDANGVDQAWVYLSYAHGNADANGTRIARARLDDNGLRDLEVLLTVEPLKDTPQHYGGAMAFMPDGTLLVTIGDGFEYREDAQNPARQLGKTLRIQRDGSFPADNPLPGDPVTGAVYTWGHRNPQGIAIDSATGVVYQHEHGPRGGDELNRLTAGANYGWPVATFGIDYTGARISPFQSRDGMTAPLTYWVPSIGPSGLTVYRGDRFPAWFGNLFVGALVNKEVRRLTLEGDRVTAEEPLFAELGERIRNVKTGPDGLLYLITDGEQGKVVRVSPAP